MNGASIFRPQLGRLKIGPIGASHITVRHGHTRPRWKQTGPDGNPPGHGEKIWIWSNLQSKQVHYSLRPELNDHQAMKQIPFTSKKAKPGSIRTDLWNQLCIVEFPEGRGDVGLSVYQRLCEFRQRHFYEWPESLHYEHDTTTGKQRQLSRQERGKKILEMKENTIADLAVVLAGAGSGNRISMTTPGVAAKGTEEELDMGNGAGLVPATVMWSNSIDKHHAVDWPQNVTHSLLPGAKVWKLQAERAF